ncbi:chemotaxis protein CheA [Colwellia sp. C1TZA3]|uniref:chemotaxis protein CheA n=1 Tax=Colwellia sp. C1TZA3 TaxID=2508879 RepID=UPI0011B9FE90|nr:chemotaxis protein CheA [Colwellia sp. C1TZA3]TWX72762.1 chemotaxis protein CheA [Colwellia sp. C1TZA3]
MIDLIDLIDTFRNEAEEHLIILEKALLEMEQNPTDSELIANCFRAMHTIKGSGGMFGFNDLTAFTHHLESAFDKIRNGHYSVTPALISIMLDSKDHIAGMLEKTEQSQVQAFVGQSLLMKLNDVIPSDQLADNNSIVQPLSAPLAEQKITKNNAFRIRFTPCSSCFADGFDTLHIVNELTSLGHCYVTTIHSNVPLLKDLNAESSYLSWDIILITEQSIEVIKDSFIFVSDDWQVVVEVIDKSLSDVEHFSHIDEILLEHGLMSSTQVISVPTKIDRLLEKSDLIAQADIDKLLAKADIDTVLAESDPVAQADIDTALAEQKILNELKQRKTRDSSDAIVRVPAARLDILMNLVGELVIVQARMKQLAKSRADDEIMSVSEDFDRLMDDLRDNTFSIRMLPIGTTFARFSRLVRDLSHELGKEIKLETIGAETELDKMVLDRLGDSLVHLIRNSIDHGIESPDIRAAAGKDRTGTIHLCAQHADSHVIINIKDDGAGLNTDIIRAKAIERGLIADHNELTEDEVNNLIFEAGFSTTDQVSEVSGRGVGMDVVKRSIEDLGGEVTLYSEAKQGTNIKIRLPMTLAIIEGLMVAVGDERYVFPLSAVEECVELHQDLENQSNGKRLVEVRGELVPYMRLREWFSVSGSAPAIEQIVVTRMGDRLFGFSVDQVIGQYQTVIKRLGKFYEGTTSFAGATILGDGSVAMILDTARLIEAIEKKTK